MHWQKNYEDKMGLFTPPPTPPSKKLCTSESQMQAYLYCYSV